MLQAALNHTSDGPAWGRPIAVFVLLSLLFGLATAVVTPPFRAPDEPAHFIRAYGFARGEILPSTADENGRKGLFVPAHIADDFHFFNEQRHRAGRPGFNYRMAMADYLQHSAARAESTSRPPVFVLFE